MPNFYNNGRQGGPVGDWNNYQGYQSPYQQTIQQMAPHQQIFVYGESGANAYPMPQGCNLLILWEADPNIKRFYIKQIDQNGRPMPLESYDYEQHVEPPAVQQSDLSKYVTVDQLTDILGRLSIGSEGRIVVNNEPSV